MGVSTVYLYGNHDAEQNTQREDNGHCLSRIAVLVKHGGSGIRTQVSLIRMSLLKLPNQEHFLYKLRALLPLLFRDWVNRYVHTRTQ